jgi:hypothetical protein
MASKKGKKAKVPVAKPALVKGAKVAKGAKKDEMPPPPRSKPSSSRPDSKMPPPRQSPITAPPIQLVVHRTTAEMEVSEQQSFELARTVMTATVSITLLQPGSIVAHCLSRSAQSRLFGRFLVFLSPVCLNLLPRRQIFPRHRFATRIYDSADPEVTYDAFMKGIKSKYTFEPSDEDLTYWKVLSRDENDPAVNKLLDWIVCGFLSRR